MSFGFMGSEVLPAAFFPYATAPRFHTALKVSSRRPQLCNRFGPLVFTSLIDEGLVGLQMLPSAWLAMEFPLHIPVHVLLRTRVIFLFFCRVFLGIGVF